MNDNDISVDDVARQVNKSRAEWLERVLTYLRTTGVPDDEIQIQDHPDLRTVVWVRSEPKFECKIQFEDEQ